MNIHVRTLIILLGSFLAVILLFGGFVYLSASEYADRDFDNMLELRVMEAAAENLGTELEGDTLYDDLFDRLTAEQDVVFPVEEQERFLEMSERMGVPISFFEEIMRDGKAMFRIGDRHFKGTLRESATGQHIVVASAQNYFKEHHVSHLRRNLLIAMIAAFVLALSISLYFSMTMFKPLHRMAEQVRQISSENLHLRMSEDHGSSEMRQLASTFNYMLDRIETSFETQNNFISNASHELRTPLTAIIGEADVALSKLRTPMEYIESIQVMLEEAGHLEQKTKALLFLAQTGFKGGSAHFSKVRMDQLLYDVKATVERVNPRHIVNLDFSLLPENPLRLKVRGNEQLLHLAISNIIVNGCKYSDNQPVTVSLGTSKDKVIVVVRDKGIGISTPDLEHIYDPFFRGANTSGYEGYGIGMPLAQKIIRMHGGELLVSSMVKVGTTVQIGLPIGRFEV